LCFFLFLACFCLCYCSCLCWCSTLLVLGLGLLPIHCIWCIVVPTCCSPPIVIPYSLLLPCCCSPIVVPCSLLFPTHHCSHFFEVPLGPLAIDLPYLLIVAFACVSLDGTHSSFFAFASSFWSYKQQAKTSKPCNYIYL
jgi:hypothetical protein